MPTENRSNDADGWIACDDGLHLIQMDKNLSHYGWVFRKVDGGLPYSVREATPHEMAHAQARQHLRIGVAQIAGQAPSLQPHPEPIAWMVGTAIWWTKEEAERDAAATGLPIVGLGPMTDASEVERFVAANTEYARRHLEHQGEVERMREENAELVALVEKQGLLLSETAIALRGPEPPKTRYSHADIPLRVKAAVQQIAERDALLRYLYDHNELSLGDDQLILAALSASAEPSAPASFQARVQPWLMECFGEMIAGDREERNHRFLEEALELVQALGATATEAHQLVDYVFGRQVGEPGQEVGGVMVTLAALCLANGLDMHQLAETELARIWTKVEQIRAKQASKPQFGPLPGVYPDRKQ